MAGHILHFPNYFPIVIDQPRKQTIIQSYINIIYDIQFSSK